MEESFHVFPFAARERERAIGLPSFHPRSILLYLPFPSLPSVSSHRQREGTLLLSSDAGAPGRNREVSHVSRVGLQ